MDILFSLQPFMCLDVRGKHLRAAQQLDEVEIAPSDDASQRIGYCNMCWGSWPGFVSMHQSMACKAGRIVPDSMACLYLCLNEFSGMIFAYRR